jgi:hypothetical protein
VPRGRKPKPTDLHDSYRAIFGTKDGERVLEHLCHVAYMTTPSYVTGDSHETAHREGMRRIVLSILRFIEKDPREIQSYNQEINEDG